jgi:AsmA-like C-terminal region
MDRRTVLTKTAKGLMEVTGKTSLLPRDLRNVLSQVDGKATVGDLHQKLDKYTETKLLDTLGKLSKDGFVREFVSAPASISPPSQVPIVQEDMDLDFTALMSKPPNKAEVSAQTKAEFEDVARQVAQARARQEADAKSRAESDARARAEAEAKSRAEAEARAKREAEARTKREAAERAAKDAAEKARRETEERARKDAEAQAKRDAEERAKREADAKAKREAEERARKDAEAQAKRDAEERAKREADAKAKREAEERARKDAEERAKREADAKAKREADAKAKREAEERARKDAEEKAKRDVDEKARREADERGRREAEERARRESEERARREGEERVQREQEDRIRRELEDRVRLAEEQARREAGERTKRDAQERAKREAAQRERREAEERNAREAEERARREADERAQRETEEEARREAEEAARHRDEEARARREAEKRTREEEKGRAKAEAEEAARARRDERAREKADAEDRARESRKEQEKDAAQVAARLEKIRAGKSGGIGKFLGIGLLVLVVVGLAYLQFFMPLDIAQYEQLASAQLGQPVKINAGNISILPSPSIRLENVTVGKDGNVKIAVASAHPDFVSAIGGNPQLKSLDLQGVTLDAAGLAGVLFGRGGSTALGLESVRATGVKLAVRGVTLPELEATATLAPDGNVRKIVVNNPNKTIAAEIQLQGGKALVDLTVAKPGALLGLPFEVESLTAKGVATASEFAASEFDARFLDGIARGKGTLRWPGSLAFDGNFELRQVDATRITPILVGRVQGTGVVAAQGESLDKLGPGARVDGNFSVSKGQIAGIDLARTLQSGKSVGGNTPFNEMTAQAQLDKGQLALRGVKIDAGPLSASGAVDVDGGKSLAGRFAADLKTPGGMLRATLQVSGTPSQLAIKR